MRPSYFALSALIFSLFYCTSAPQTFAEQPFATVTNPDGSTITAGPDGVTATDAQGNPVAPPDFFGPPSVPNNEPDSDDSGSDSDTDSTPAQDGADNAGDSSGDSDIPDLSDPDSGSDGDGSFSDGSGLDMEDSSIEYRDGSEDQSPRKTTGMKKYSDITLKRGTIDSRDSFGENIGLSSEIFSTDGSDITSTPHRVRTSGAMKKHDY